PDSSLSNVSMPNLICGGVPGAAYATCVPDLYVDFPNTANGLQLTVVSYTTGTVAGLNVFVGGTLTATLPVNIQASLVGQVVDLSGYGSVTRIELVMITAPYGVGMDDFRFSALP